MSDALEALSIIKQALSGEFGGGTYYEKYLLPSINTIRAALEQPSTAEAQAIEALKDPSVVYLNIMRGIIGKPSWDHIQELYPEAKEK